MKSVLIANSYNEKCGVHQYGLNLASILRKSDKLHVTHDAFHSAEQFLTYARGNDVVIYNWHPSTMPWLTQGVVDELRVSNGFNAPVEQCMIVGHDHYRTFNGVLNLDCDCMKELERPILQVANLPEPEELTVGSFGFAFDFKNFDTIPKLVAEQLPNARLRMHLTPHPQGDSQGRIIQLVRESCEALGLKYELTNKFIDGEDLVRFLAGNSINVFLYPPSKGRGISSSIDFALAAGRPFALSDSEMFRHVNHDPRFLLSRNSLPEILGYGTEPLKPFLQKWHPDRLIKRFETLLTE